MKTLVVYYSFSGNTRELAQKEAESRGADICQVVSVKKRNTFTAYTYGAFAALRRKRDEILPLDCDLSGYDEIIIMSPVWAGRCPPAVYALFDLLPEGKNVEMIMTSMSGDGSFKAEFEDLTRRRQCRPTVFTAVRC